MNKQALQAQIQHIVEQMNEALRFYPRELLQMYYARQLATLPPEVRVQAHSDEAGNKRIEKMMAEASLTWEYATEAQKRKLQEIAEIIAEHNNQIAALFRGRA
jgi:hypothetical protein